MPAFVSHSDVHSGSYVQFAPYKRGVLKLKVLRAVVADASGYQSKFYQ